MPALITTCKLNQLLDAVAFRLSLSVKPKAGLNLVPTPVTVKRVIRLGDFTGLAKPILAVQSISWNATPGCASRFEGVLRFVVHVLVTAKEGGGDEIDLLNLCTDVIRTMNVDISFGGLVTMCFPLEFTPMVDQSSALTGFAQAAITYEATYTWDAETP